MLFIILVVNWLMPPSVGQSLWKLTKSGTKQTGSRDISCFQECMVLLQFLLPLSGISHAALGAFNKTFPLLQILAVSSTKVCNSLLCLLIFLALT